MRDELSSDIVSDGGDSLLASRTVQEYRRLALFGVGNVNWFCAGRHSLRTANWWSATVRLKKARIYIRGVNIWRTRVSHDGDVNVVLLKSGVPRREERLSRRHLPTRCCGAEVDGCRLRVGEVRLRMFLAVDLGWVVFI